MINLYEIFDEFEAAPTREEKINVLRKYDRPPTQWSLRNVLIGTFDRRVQFYIKKVPYYKPSDSPPGLGYSTIHTELERIYLLEVNNPRSPPTLTQKRREEILIQMLEALEAREATVFINMILKDLKVKGLDVQIVNEAIPGLIPPQDKTTISL